MTPEIAVLKRARELVQAGWCQGHGFGTKCCSIQALCQAAQGLYGNSESVASSVCKEFRATIDSPTIITWNDEEGRTVAQVLDAIDLTILRLEGV